jgi:hypothetical protein
MRIGLSGIPWPPRRFENRGLPEPAGHRPKGRAPAEIPQPVAPSSDAEVRPSDEHEVMSRRSLHELEHIAEVGASDKTPLILLGDVWVVSAIVVLAVLAVSLLAYHLAT